MRSLQDIGGPATFLKQPLDSVNNLRPLPILERLAMRAAFKNEEMRLGPSQEWLNRKWDLRLGAVSGVIYKAAIETSASDKADAVDATISVSAVLEKAFGEPIRQGDAIFLWDANDGNVVLQLAIIGGDRRIMLFLTSNIANEFESRFKLL